jgi:hypothetical protein
MDLFSSQKRGVKMSAGTATTWTLQVLLETTWESVKFPSREAAMMTLGSIIDDYGIKVTMAHLISPRLELEIANLYNMLAQRASLSELRLRQAEPHSTA